ncbi:MAG: low specificity L-threonine aldolase, partial [Pseudolabrys sp.]|nr:low specificity L-threonine aldolase [Pseudolabrys sp.]
EAWGGGTKLIPLLGENGRISIDALESKLVSLPRGRPQVATPKVVSITQGTEAGTLYSLNQIAEISALAHEHKMKVHMDGARFSNALAALDCSPAEMTWKAGIDVLSYGATKNGGMSADGVVVFDETLLDQATFLIRRNGQLYSKMRFLSVQLLALAQNGVAERNARHANEMARRLAAGLSRVPDARLLNPVEINEVFVSLPARARERLVAAGYKIQLRAEFDNPHYRFVTAWNTSSADVDQLAGVAGGL